MSRNLYAFAGSTRFRAIFIASLLLFNLFLPTLSSAVVYADTAESEESLEVTEIVDEPLLEEVELPEEEATEETESNLEETQVLPEDDEQEPVEEETTPEVVSVVQDHDEIIDEDYPVLDGSFVCWYQVSLTEFTFFIEVESEDNYEIDAGSMYNMADPESQNSILLTEFDDGEHEYEVMGWDGTEFEWTLGQSEFTVSTEGQLCDEAPTILDILTETEELSGLVSAFIAASDARECSGLAKVLGSPLAADHTVFAPSNAALSSLVSTTDGLINELTQLVGNPDEMCALIASHIVAGRIVSTDATEDGVVVYTIENDLDGLFIQVVGSSVQVDGATVTTADLIASNGVVHIVDAVLLPQSAGTINPVVTDNISPALSGNISLPMSTGDDYYPMFCVVVRIDGTPYIADVDGMSWTIDQGVVVLNPTNEQTLFDVVVRYADGECVPSEEMDDGRMTTLTDTPDIVRAGFMLVGLTMNRGVVSFPVPEEPEEEEETGEVLGTTTEVEAPTPVVVAASCGKGLCGEVAQVSDPTTTDSDGDGVVDADDPAPNDPEIDGTEDESSDTSTETTTDEADDTAEDDDDNDVFWWFVVGGGATVLGYLYRQRSGGAS